MAGASSSIKQCGSHVSFSLCVDAVVVNGKCTHMRGFWAHKPKSKAAAGHVSPAIVLLSHTFILCTLCTFTFIQLGLRT